MVHPSQQRKGIGRRLMGEVMSRADGEGVPTMIVSSMESYGLYSKLGFRGLGTFPIDSGYWMREVDRIEGELGMEGQGLGKQYEGVREDESWMVRWLKGGESGEAE